MLKPEDGRNALEEFTAPKQEGLSRKTLKPERDSLQTVDEMVEIFTKQVAGTLRRS